MPEDGEALRGSRDIGVRGLDLLVQELDLLARLSEPLPLRLEPVARAGEVVGEDLELGPDLPCARVDLLRRCGSPQAPPGARRG